MSVLAAGVDWITCTAGGYQSRKNLIELGRDLVKEQAAGGFYRRVQNRQGYLGESAGGAFAGERHDGSMVILSGSLAAMCWADLAVRSTNVSRLDLQVTVHRAEPPLVNLAAAHNREVGLANRRRGRPITRDLRIRDDAPQTLYLGSRQSETFARCYDKHAEKPEEYPPHSWRYEVEYKGDASGVVAGKLADTSAAYGRIVSTVHDVFSKRGASPVFAPEAAPVSAQWDVPVTDRRKALNWLHLGVAPTLRRAQREGWLEEAILSLTGSLDLGKQ